MRLNYAGILIYLIIISALYYTAFQEDFSKPNVLLVAGEEASTEIIQRITLSKNYFNFKINANVNDINDFDVLVLYCTKFNRTILDWVYAGGKILYLPGFSSMNDSFLYSIGSFKIYENEVELVANESNPNQIVNKINWMSAPRVSYRIGFDTFNLKTEVYVSTRPVGSFDSAKKPFIFKVYYGSGEIIFLSAILNNATIDKEPILSFINWPYFNYLLYLLIEESLGRDGASYGDWEYSPVPHDKERVILLVLPLILAIISFTLIYLVSKYCRKNPISNSQLTWLIQKDKGKISEWEEAGLHKQFAGLAIKYFFMVLTIPWGIVWGIVWIRYIVKYPMSLGINDWLGGLTGIIWFLFDFGTSFAALYYFSEYRANNPKEAIKYVQFFIWWQFVTGIIQIAIVTNIAAWYLVNTRLAFITWVLISLSLGQYPGFMSFPDIVLKGMQRFDYLEIGVNLFGILQAIFQGILALIIRDLLLSNNITLGAILATCIALNISGYITSWFSFLLWSFLLKKLGLKVLQFLRIDFTWETVKKALSYGGKSMAGDAFIVLAWTIEVWLISEYIPNYGEWIAFLSLINAQFGLASTVTDMVTRVLPSISEAHGYRFNKLVELYYIETWAYANTLLFLIIAITFAVIDIQIVGYYGPTWTPALILVPFQTLFYYASPPAWVNDQIQFGTGHPGYRAIVTIFEQIVRIGLMLIFVVKLGWGIIGAVVCYNVALLLKDIFTTMITYTKILKFEFYPWNIYIAPTIAMLITIIITRIPALVVWKFIVGDNPEQSFSIAGILPMTIGMIGAVIATIIAAVIGVIVYVFLIGFLHAIDRNLFEDLRKSMGLIGPAGKFTYIIGIPWAYYLGESISPFKRFRISIYEEAQKEIKKLNELKAKNLFKQ